MASPTTTGGGYASNKGELNTMGSVIMYDDTTAALDDPGEAGGFGAQGDPFDW